MKFFKKLFKCKSKKGSSEYWDNNQNKIRNMTWDAPINIDFKTMKIDASDRIPPWWPVDIPWSKVTKEWWIYTWDSIEKQAQGIYVEPKTLEELGIDIKGD